MRSVLLPISENDSRTVTATHTSAAPTLAVPT